ncbi:hypothetical protein HN51_046357 [Arachis hypogaea]
MQGNSNANTAPMNEQESGPSVATVETQSMPPKAPFKPPAQSTSRPARGTFRPKQPVRRKPVTNKPSQPVPPAQMGRSFFLHIYIKRYLLDDKRTYGIENDEDEVKVAISNFFDGQGVEVVGSIIAE